MTSIDQNQFQMNLRIKKRLEFGQAIYVAGDVPQLGCWDISKALRLSWNDIDIWTASLQFGCIMQTKIQYKYFISFWNGPNPTSILWQDGNHNRVIYPKLKHSNQIIDDKWNMQKISLNLMVAQDQDVYNNYSVIGNHIQLGNWKTRIPLNKSNKVCKSTLLQIDTDEHTWEDFNIYSYSFQIYRGREKFRYYYIREASYLCEPERHPGRLFILGKENSHHPDYFKTLHNNGKVQLYEKCNFQLLNFSKITDKLFLGAYPKSLQDITTLKNQGIKAILSIQTQDDFQRHDVSEENFKEVCKNQEIEIQTYSIKDMDKQDFLKKADGALQILKRWSDLNFTIYVHCSAGIYRSPQILILHLISTFDYDLDKATELVKLKHPYANPNIELISSTSQKLKTQKIIVDETYFEGAQNALRDSQAQKIQKQSKILQEFQDFKEKAVQESMGTFQYH